MRKVAIIMAIMLAGVIAKSQNQFTDYLGGSYTSRSYMKSLIYKIGSPVIDTAAGQGWVRNYVTLHGGNTYTAGFGLGLNNKQFYNSRYWKGQDSLSTLLSTGLVKVISGKLSSITDNSTNWNTAYSWGQSLKLDQTIPQTIINGSPAITEGLLIGADANYTDFPLAKLVVSKGNTGHTYAGPIGLTGESISDASNVGVGVGGVAKTSSAQSARGVVGVGKVNSTSDAQPSLGGYFRSEDTHAGGVNVGVSARAVNGAGNYAISLAGGDISSLTNNLSWLLQDNQSAPLTFSSVGKSDILKLNSTDGSEGIQTSGNLTVTGNTTINSSLNGVLKATNGLISTDANIITGSLTSGYIPVASGSNSVVNSSITVIGSNITSPITQKTTAIYESASLGAELLTSTGWVSDGWTGMFEAGFSHSVGNTNTLSNTISAIIGGSYQITYTVINRTAGTFSIMFGGQQNSTLSATGNYGPKATTTGSLIITPTNDFNGTIIISIKLISSYLPFYTIKDNTEGNSFEIRTSLGSAGNSFTGIDAGRMNTTGNGNIFQGYQAGFSNTTGSTNIFQGYQAGFSNTTGNGNAFQGYRAGRYISDGITANTTSDYCNIIGFDARVLADNDQNEIVIGSSAIGRGSNTATFGNNSITNHYFAGNINLNDGINATYFKSTNTATAATATDGSLFGINSIGMAQINQQESLGFDLFTNKKIAFHSDSLQNSKFFGTVISSYAGASTTQAGTVKLSNLYNGTSQALATTEKAVTDGLTTKLGVSAKAADSDMLDGVHLQSGLYAASGVLSVGSFGLGNATDNNYINNANALSNNGNYVTAGVFTGSPFTGSNDLNQGYLKHQTWGDGSYAEQTFYNVNAGNYRLFRRKNNNVWENWLTIWHSGNINLSTVDFAAKNIVASGYITSTTSGATTTQAGTTTLSNSYSGTSEVKAVTEKALKDGLATKTSENAFSTITDAASITYDCSTGNNKVLTTTRSTSTLTVSNAESGHSYSFVIYANANYSMIVPDGFGASPHTSSAYFTDSVDGKKIELVTSNNIKGMIIEFIYTGTSFLYKIGTLNDGVAY